jgi:hypothetical protein
MLNSEEGQDIILVLIAKYLCFQKQKKFADKKKINLIVLEKFYLKGQ